MQKGKFDLNDLADQLKQMQKMGGMGGIMGMMPGIGKMKEQMAAAGLDDSVFKRQLAIISSMTKAERANPDLLKHNRKKRIAAGSGTSVQEINKLLKMHRQMADMMKTMGKGGMKGLMGSLGGMMGGGGMMGKMMGGGMPGGFGGEWAACRTFRRWTRRNSSAWRRRDAAWAAAECRSCRACRAGGRISRGLPGLGKKK